MRNPLWIINSILIILFIATITFIGLSLRKTTENINIEKIIPEKITLSTKQEKPSTKDIKYIYQGNDLFGTYKTKTTPPQEISVPDLPKPPQPKPVVEQKNPVIQFLDPLPIKISGIISHNNESKSQVSIINNNTKESKSYKIGDKILDAYIIRIFPKKIILIRSNGQQETLYMYPNDAKEDIEQLKDLSWQDTIQKIEKNKFSINTTNFIAKIKSLAQLIEMLDATTAFKKGVSLGCRIGKMSDNSIGKPLGLVSGDIITSISGIAPTSTTNRINIYNIISNSKNGDTIKVEILRKNTKIEQEYLLKDDNTNTEKKLSNNPVTEILALNKKDIFISDKKREMSKVKTANRICSIQPQIKELKRHTINSMNKYGSRNSILKSLT